MDASPLSINLSAVLGGAGERCGQIMGPEGGILHRRSFYGTGVLAWRLDYINACHGVFGGYSSESRQQPCGKNSVALRLIKERGSEIQEAILGSDVSILSRACFACSTSTVRVATQ
jgi:hypothetical protein